MSEREAELISVMQKDAEQVKAILGRMSACAGELVTINHEAGRLVQSADAMIWQGAVGRARYDIIAAHGVASKALISGYDTGASVVAYGPGR